MRKNHKCKYLLTVQSMLDLCKAAIEDGIHPDSPIHITMDDNRLTIYEISANDIVWKQTGKRSGPYLRIRVGFSPVAGEIISN